MKPVPIDDCVKPGEPCECEFQPDPDEPDGAGSWHYFRKCQRCGTTWWGLHCPHDGYQNPCPGCGMRPVTISEA